MFALDEIREAVDHHLPNDPEIEPRDLDLNVCVWALEVILTILTALDAEPEAKLRLQVRLDNERERAAAVVREALKE